MSDEHKNFIRQIVADPDNDTPRLIYADWLEEQGDPRGEFIRVQVELFQLANQPVNQLGNQLVNRPAEAKDRIAELQKREAALLHDHYDEWVGPLTGLALYGVPAFEFVRGLIEDISMRPAKFMAKPAQKTLCQQLSWIGANHLRLWDASKQVKKLADCEALAWVGSVAWINCNLQDDMLIDFLSSPHLKEVTSLRFEKLRCSNKGLQFMAAAEGCPQIQQLFLDAPVQFATFDAAGVGELVKLLPHLQTIRISDLLTFRLKDFVSAAGESLGKLRAICLGWGCNRGFSAMASCPHLANLEWLEMFSHDQIVDDDILQAMVDNPALAKLQHFSFEEGLRSEPKYSPETLVRLRKRFPSGKPQPEA